MQMISSFNAGIMLSLQDKALIIKLFYQNDESITVALKKFRTAKGVKEKTGPISLSGILKLVKRIEETSRL